MVESSSKENLWRNIFIGGLVVGVILRIYLYINTGWTIPDAYIAFQFGEQFGSGHGLVFNTGERVSGNTSVLFTFLLGLGSLCGFGVQAFARVIGICSDVVTMFLVRRILKSPSGLKSPELVQGIPVVVFLFPLTLPYATGGLETSLYVALIFLLLDRTLRGADWKYCLSAGLLMFCRPDSMVAISASLLFLTLKNRKLPWRAGFTLFAIGLVYLALNRLYYGTLVPNTMVVKKLVSHDSAWTNFHYIAATFVKSDLLLVVSIVALAGLLLLARSTDCVALAGLACAGYFLFLLSAPHLRSWYVVPFFYLSVFAACAALGTLFDSKIPVLSFKLPLAFAAVYFIACSFAFFKITPALREVRNYQDHTVRDAGLWLKNNTPTNATVFLTALEMGYFAKRHIYDSPGLVTPAVVDMIRNGRGKDLFDEADEVKADYMVIPNESGAHTNYSLIRTFDYAHPRPGFDLKYALYKRVSAQ